MPATSSPHAAFVDARARRATRLLCGLGVALILAGCQSLPSAARASSSAPGDVVVPEKADPPLTTQPWSEVVVSVRDLDETARFFREIGGYETRARGPVDAAELAYWGLPEGARGEALSLAAPGSTHGLVRLVRFEEAGPAAPMRPGGHAWDTGCFFSVMVRMKDMDAVYEDALALGWWTETPIADLDFGTSKLKVAIYKGPDGLQVQGYERLEPPLPPEIPPFERFTQPFNLMQMVGDRDLNGAFYRGVLGFETFFYGKPFVSPIEQPTPIAIPLSLTDEVRYQTGIYYPVPGEFGRLENIDIMDISGFDFSDRCHAPNYGILAVRYRVESAEETRALIEARDWPVDRPVVRARIGGLGAVDMLGVTTPDGAMIDFIAPVR